MFNLAILKDTMSIHPSLFGIPVDQALISELNKKYANRVLHRVGLCICVFDLSQVGEGKVRYGDGCLWYKVVFRMVVFRPFASEVILAKVKSSDKEGIRLTLGFFDDITIPASYLPQPSAFDPNERAHFWLPDSNLTTSHEMLDTPVSERMYVDQSEIVRVRVEADEFCDDEPGPPKASASNPGMTTMGGEPPPAGQKRRAPYNVVCSMAEQGLGPVPWWNGAEMQVDEEDGDA